MRRQRNVGHPAQQVILGNSGFYTNPSDPSGIKRVVGTASELLWANLPTFPSLRISGIHAEIIQFLDADSIDESKWTSVKDDNAPSVALRSGSGGGVIIQTGDEEGHSYHYYHKEDEAVEFESGKSSWVRYDIKIEQLEDSEGYSLGIGFQQDGELWPDGDPTDIVNIQISSTALVVSSEAGGDYSYASFVVEDFYWPRLDDGNFHEIGIRVRPDALEPDKFDILVFVDGIYGDTWREVPLPSVPLHPYVGDSSHSDRITVRGIGVIQED